MISSFILVVVIYGAVVCWGSITATDTYRINKIIHDAGKIIGHNLETRESFRDRRSRNKQLSIMDNPSNPLHDTL